MHLYEVNQTLISESRISMMGKRILHFARIVIENTLIRDRNVANYFSF